MKTKLIIGLFICVAFVQIFVPLSMIAKRESVLKNGTQFKFKTAPIDPYDAFRGRYVALSIERDYIPEPKEIKLHSGQIVYLPIETDAQGFATFTTATTSKPYDKPYIKAKVRSIWNGSVYLDLPINRYYMEEKTAPIAEKIYRRHTRGNKQDAHVVVRVKDGFAVIENLFVGGQRIEDAVKQQIERYNNP